MRNCLQVSTQNDQIVSLALSPYPEAFRSTSAGFETSPLRHENGTPQNLEGDGNIVSSDGTNVVSSDVVSTDLKGIPQKTEGNDNENSNDTMNENSDDTMNVDERNFFFLHPKFRLEK